MVNKDESKNLKYRKSFFRTRSIDLYAFHIDAGCHSRSIRAAILARPVQRRLSAGEIRCAADEAVKSTFKSTIALAGWLVGFAGPTHVRRWGSALANLLLATGDDCHTLPTDQRAGSGPSADDMTAWGLHRMLGCYIVMRWVLQKKTAALIYSHRHRQPCLRTVLWTWSFNRYNCLRITTDLLLLSVLNQLGMNTVFPRLFVSDAGCLVGCLVGWCLTALSAQIGYIVSCPPGK